MIFEHKKFVYFELYIKIHLGLMNKFNLIQRKGFVISPVERLFSRFRLFFLLADK